MRALRLAALLVGVLTVGPASAQEAVEVQSAPVATFDDNHPEQAVFGRLRFLGGIQIESSDERFGGLSGIEISPDGRRILLVSDIGDLFSATIDYKNGIITGLSGVTVSRLTGVNGAALGDKESADAEALRGAGGGGLPADILVGFERNNRVLDYQLDAAGNAIKVTRIPLPKTVNDLTYNKGIEGIAVFPPGAPHAGDFVAFAETSADSAPDVIPGWLVSPSGARDIGLKRIGDYDVTDAIALPDGDLIVLERAFSFLFGAGMRLRSVSASEIDGPQPMSGTILFSASMAYEIDNMEGLAVHRDDAGRIILTIVSDDNFSPLQRTLLLQFAIL